LTATLAELAPQLARALARRDETTAAVTKSAQALHARQAKLVETEIARAALLDGEATIAHRDRHLSAQSAAVARLDAARSAQAQATSELAALAARAQDAEAAGVAAVTAASEASAAFTAGITQLDGTAPDAERLTSVRRLLDTPAASVAALRAKIDALTGRLADATTALNTRRADLAEAQAIAMARDPSAAPAADLASLKATATALAAAIVTLHGELAAHSEKLRRDDQDRAKSADLNAEIVAAETDLAVWRDVDAAIGSAQGDKFRKFAQSITLDQLVRLANGQLAAINPRFTLVRSATSDLGLHMMDRDLGDDTRSIRSLSGGERFLVSLALALALSGLEGRQSFVDTLFIDEGFGSLDADTLDTAISALETLQSQGRKVGVITHVAAMIDRIAVAIRVEKRGPGRSIVRLDDGSRGMFSVAA
jgi:DNA repair protein SbcC/Rad50